MDRIGVVLWLPGGGWRGFSDEDGSALADHGLEVVQGRYRLSHEARWPAQLEDVRAAARVARQRAGDRPLLVAGDSAGGHLALHLALRGIDPVAGVAGVADVAGVLAFWPPVDPLAPDFIRLRRHDNPWIGLLGHEPAADDPDTADATVTTHVGNRVPVLLAHGVSDPAVPVTQTLTLTSALIGAGHPVHALITDGGHAQDLRRDDIQALIAAFVATTLPGR